MCFDLAFAMGPEFGPKTTAEMDETGLVVLGWIQKQKRRYTLLRKERGIQISNLVSSKESTLQVLFLFE
jgi:hypothetical protein